MNSSRKGSFWNSYKSSNQTLQLYQSKRKEQRAKKMNDQMAFNISSELSTPSDSQMMDDSQNFPSSQSQESCSWNPRAPSFKPKRNPNAPWSRSGFYSMDSDMKPDYRQYIEEAEKVAKEKEEREMLQNFLLSAKQCCEEANMMATQLNEKQEAQTATLIAKFQKLAEDISIDKLVENNNIQMKKLDTNLEACLEKLQALEKQFENHQKSIAEHEASMVSAVQECWRQDVLVLKEHLCNQKPICTEMATQYSPRIFTAKESQTCFSPTVQQPSVGKHNRNPETKQHDYVPYAPKHRQSTKYQHQFNEERSFPGQIDDDYQCYATDFNDKENFKTKKTNRKTRKPRVGRKQKTVMNCGSSGASISRAVHPFSNERHLENNQKEEATSICSPGLLMVPSKVRNVF
uniref:Receptor-interacting serine/threonine-protein kinase 1-like n=1 Tax=Phallusia mammillata TaxID=59560 RepID=A0A6F9DRD5_9ASCI|nr:receptor-interacting serine/threonine-protein kinase 1-like [Phallusia mammillata]